ncbi:unnamed protein product [Linum tenue]|uniref:Uncharacterized protein n=2 Tax=Linum TaxID=4005 RepID=A0AAV0RN84_9ROSI|nr:unnamed protein product [Linum tenue]
MSPSNSFLYKHTQLPVSDPRISPKLSQSEIESGARVRANVIGRGKMAMRRFYNEIKGLKVKEVPDHVKPMLSLDFVKKSVQKGLDNYHAKYIQTSSVDPLLHVCFGGMVFSYLVALPEERRHLEHQQHAKEHGGH